MRKYTKEQLLFFLKKLSQDINKTPTIKNINAHKKLPSSATYSKRFGSWNKALKEAGLRLNAKKAYTKHELLENLKIIAKEIGRTPLSKDLKGRKWAGSYATYKKYFGNFKNAIMEAQLRKGNSQNLKKYSKK